MAAKVEIYVWRACPFCIRAVGLLNRKGVDYIEYAIDGDAAARELRDSLDRLQPGLGNPVMKVEVHDVATEVGAEGAHQADPQDALELQQGLARIAARLEQLEQRREPNA